MSDDPYTRLDGQPRPDGYVKASGEAEKIRAFYAKQGRPVVVTVEYLSVKGGHGVWSAKIKSEVKVLPR